MYVCICNAITEREIRQCAELGAATLCDLRGCLGVASCCGTCAKSAQEVLDQHQAARELPQAA